VRTFLALVRKELIVLLRDWHALLLLFIMPTLFILLMSLALRDKFAPGTDAPFSYFLVNGDSADALGDTLAAGIREGQAFRDLGAGAGPERDVEAVRAGRAQFLVVVPNGFTRSITTDRPAALTISVSPAVDQPTAQLFGARVREAVSRVFAMRTMDGFMQRFGAFVPGGAPAVGITPSAMNKLVLQQSLYAVGERPRQPTSVQQNVPAWLVFAMFFVALPLSTTWMQERRQGTFTRLRSLGLSPLQLLTAKLAPYYLINLVQVVLMLAVGVYLVPLFGGDALTLGNSAAGLTVMSLAVSFAAVSYALLIANIVSTVEQATILTGVSNLLLAALGGVLVPRFVMPLAMQKFAVVSPMAWGLEGFLDVFLRDGGLSAVASKALLLFGFGAASLFFAGLMMRRAGGR
jgi:ABC-2 type transport system permease protein